MASLTPIVLLTGYLGAGKTLLMNHILANGLGGKVAVIVNDIGEINIDAELIARSGGTVSAAEGGLIRRQRRDSFGGRGGDRFGGRGGER